MPGESRGRRWYVVALAVFVALLVAAGVASAGPGVIDAAGRYLPWSSPASSCPVTDVTVVAAPQVAGVVRKVTAPLTGRVLADESCLRVVVEPEAPITTVEGAASTATSELPQIWIPDSSLWASQTTMWTTEPIGSIATSPVVLAASRASVARLGWQGVDVTWAQGLDVRRHAIATPAITNDAASLLSLLALAQTLGPGIATEQQIAATVLAASRTGVTDLGSAIDLARTSSPRLPAVLLTDQQTVANANADKPNGLVAVRPVGLPAQLDYPILRVRSSDEDPVVKVATDVVLAALTAPAARQTATAAGFGPPSGVAAPQTDQGRAALAQAAKSTARFVSLVRTLALPSRLLVAMDTSLSMEQPVRPGLSRAGLAAAAAIGAGRLLPDRSAIGLWTFAGRQAGGRPYQELAKIDALSAVDRVDATGKEITHRDVVEAALVALPRRLTSGGTGLYDTALAALRTARANFDPQANNAVVVFTDGANDYAPGLTLPSFLKQARADAASDRQRPILLIAIGIGPGADMKALTAMTRAAGGRAYQANTVAQLQTVLFDAIAHRRVLPGQFISRY